MVTHDLKLEILTILFQKVHFFFHIGWSQFSRSYCSFNRIWPLLSIFHKFFFFTLFIGWSRYFNLIWFIWLWKSYPSFFGDFLIFVFCIWIMFFCNFRIIFLLWLSWLRTCWWGRSVSACFHCILVYLCCCDTFWCSLAPRSAFNFFRHFAAL